uniref:Uncharacterized protein n=1 Tax=Ciona intestinalis TaxID=7719 RepID=H2XTA4_CIOIN
MDSYHQAAEMKHLHPMKEADPPFPCSLSCIQCEEDFPTLLSLLKNRCAIHPALIHTNIQSRPTTTITKHIM